MFERLDFAKLALAFDGSVVVEMNNVHHFDLLGFLRDGLGLE